MTICGAPGASHTGTFERLFGACEASSQVLGSRKQRVQPGGSSQGVAAAMSPRARSAEKAPDWQQLRPQAPGSPAPQRSPRELSPAKARELLPVDQAVWRSPSPSTASRRAGVGATSPRCRPKLVEPSDRELFGVDRHPGQIRCFQGSSRSNASLRCGSPGVEGNDIDGFVGCDNHGHNHLRLASRAHRRSAGERDLFEPGAPYEQKEGLQVQHDDLILASRWGLSPRPLVRVKQMRHLSEKQMGHVPFKFDALAPNDNLAQSPRKEQSDTSGLLAWMAMPVGSASPDRADCNDENSGRRQPSPRAPSPNEYAPAQVQSTPAAGKASGPRPRVRGVPTGAGGSARSSALRASSPPRWRC